MRAALRENFPVTPTQSFARSSLPSISQLRAADTWGRRTGDFICGPLAFYALLASERQTLHDLKKFLRLHFPDFLRSSKKAPRAAGLTLDEGLVRLKETYSKALAGYRVVNLNRRPGQKDLLQGVSRTLDRAATLRKPILLQIGAYCGSVENGNNRWSRTLGHFVTLTGMGARPGKRDPMRELQYWDPWDGSVHSGVLYEEVFRDFTALKPPAFTNGFRSGHRTSPNGHRVLSPYLCLLAPHMDLYSNQVYFAQRYLYAIERALIPAGGK